MAAATAVAYLPVLGSLLALWRADRYYAYLVLVVPIFALLLWVSRARRPVTVHGERVGIVIAMIALALLLLGRSVSNLQLQSLSLVVAVAGAAVCLCGIRWARAAAYPLAFLLFLVPIPRTAIDAVTLDVQRLLTRHAGTLLKATGIPVQIEETAIHLPTVTLQIVEGCNGLSFLLALVVIIGGAAGMLVPSLRGRVFLIAFAVPAALAANVIRITGTGLAAHWLGPEGANGEFHLILGKVIWAFTTVTLVLLAWRLGRRPVATPALAEPRGAV